MKTAICACALVLSLSTAPTNAHAHSLGWSILAGAYAGYLVGGTLAAWKGIRSMSNDTFMEHAIFAGIR